MCLSNISKKHIAEKDIICYKVVINTIYSSSDLAKKFKSGDSFTCKINNINAEGEIFINCSNVYLCTNNVNFDGIGQRKYGYKYSWKLDHNVSNIIINGIVVDCSYSTPYLNANVSLGEEYESTILIYKNTISKALHSFKYKNDAMISCYDCGGVTVECVIPKGSTYYVGEFNDKPSYASNKLKYIKII
jgi:hypothetical protein